MSVKYDSRYDTENPCILPRGRLTPERAEDLRPGDRIILPDPDGHNLYAGAPMVIVHAIGSLGDDRTIMVRAPSRRHSASARLIFGSSKR